MADTIELQDITGGVSSSNEFDLLTGTIEQIRKNITNLTNRELEAITHLGKVLPGSDQYNEAREHLESIQKSRDDYEKILERAIENRRRAVDNLRVRKIEEIQFHRRIKEIDHIAEEEDSHDHGHGEEKTGWKRFYDPFFLGFGFLQIALMILYWVFVDYEAAFDPSTANGHDNNIGGFYQFYIDVTFMMYIGFGYLMTFLRRYGFGAVGYTFLLSAFAVEWGLLCMGIARLVAAGGPSHNLTVSVVSLIDGDFAAVAVLISFGALIGKTTPAQLLFLTFWEVIFYSITTYVGQFKVGAVDMGGSMFIHCFGAFFGLAATVFLSPKPEGKSYDHKISRYTSDLFAMVGTVFLYILWPSFNGALAPSGSQPRVVINTILALIASCTATFTWSQFLRPHGKRFDMVDIQNATLAGGVAVGSSSDLIIGPGGALLIGLAAGSLSTFGFVYIGPWFERHFGLQDTCGILNLHGLPGLLGGITGAIACSNVSDNPYGIDVGSYFPHGFGQARYQIFGLLIVLGLSITSGLLVGFVTSKLFKTPKRLFEDDVGWEVAPDYYKLKTDKIDVEIHH
eukprot:TRINITY_DN2446_c0_g1_i3.p1 TRINITY_DN2446_c0_g1~~TRINITY_DN2446_c0_g1_i3.p1  ORF type:complete len:568 (+),score=125.11 TRINITY_DN2446_c0_g1_i3:450-2153(+)